MGTKPAAPRNPTTVSLGDEEAVKRLCAGLSAMGFDIVTRKHRARWQAARSQPT
jgi:hypothetical protein